MTLLLEATVFQNPNMNLTGTYPVSNYTLVMDAISNNTSTFILPKNKGIEAGNFIAIKSVNDNLIIYYGQITAIDVNDVERSITVSSNYLWNVLNGEIVVKSISGNSYEQHLRNMITKYIDSTNSSNILKYSVMNSTNTAFTVTSSDGMSTSNFIDYMIRGFKLHNVIFDVIGITSVNKDGGSYYYPQINIHQTTDTWSFKNDVYDFTNWSVTDSRGLRSYNNELWIVDKASANMESPTIMAKYWLQNDGSVVKSINDNVFQPTQVHIYLYDKTATDNPTNDSIAQTELQGNTYSHNIQFSMPLKNNFLPVSKLKLGLQSMIYYNDKVYKSILTGFTINSDSESVSLIFGNLRFGRNDLFNSSN